MKAVAYINDTYTQEEKDDRGNWQDFSKARILDYFRKHGIDTKVIGLDDPFVTTLDSHYNRNVEPLPFKGKHRPLTIWYKATIRKLAKWYHFHQDDYDLALFVDLDVLVAQDHVNILDRINDTSKIYCHKYGYGTPSETFRYEVIMKDSHLSQPYEDVSTGFMIINKSHAERFLAWLGRNNRNLLDEDHYRDMVEWSLEVQQELTKISEEKFSLEEPHNIPVHVVNDEYLFNAALNQELFKQEELFESCKLCYELPLRPKDGQPVDYIDLDRLLDYDPVFMHLISWWNKDKIRKYSRFKIVGSEYN